MIKILFVIFLLIRFLVFSLSVVSSLIFFCFISSMRFMFLSVVSSIIFSIVSSILLSVSVVSSSSILVLIFFSFGSSLSIISFRSIICFLSIISLWLIISFRSISVFVPVISPCLSMVLSVLVLFRLMVFLSSFSVGPGLSVFPLAWLSLSSVLISRFSFFFIFVSLSLFILDQSTLVIKYPSIGLVISSALKASLKPTLLLSFSLGYLVSVILKIECSFACPSVSLLSANSMYCYFSSQTIRQRPATFLWKMLTRPKALQKLFITHITSILLNLLLPKRAKLISLNKIALCLLSLSRQLVLNSVLSKSEQPVQGAFFCSAGALAGSAEGAYCLFGLASSEERVGCQC